MTETSTILTISTIAEISIKSIMGVMLLICGVQDIQKKKIYVWMIIVAAVLIGICVPFCNEITLPDRVGGVVVGVAMILVSLFTAGKLGLGDGILLCATGLGLGFWGNLELLAIALLLAAIVSIVLLILRLADRKKSIPFVPFILLGYVFIIISNVRTGV